MEVYEKILSGNPQMPTFFTRNLSDLIKKLLRSQQGKRLGNTRGGTAAVVKHKWFSSFDWASIENGEAKAPYMPTIKGKDDVTNFDQFDEGEVAVSLVAGVFVFLILFCIFFLFDFCFLYSACERLEPGPGGLSPWQMCSAHVSYLGRTDRANWGLCR
jgi:hypothetical protein